ncbi:transcription termination factor NusA [Sneathia sanguinegens]|jgi:hypothetical protein|uniref:transcription termination factor NusA n=1 Tax=Sneathia sanguinegens TaxID=40543 RepID=UPI000832265F|nr:transcription termination factor NusA [Sneathia sanguinegens]
MKAKEQGIFLAALDELEKDKGLKKEELLLAVETALLAAYKRNYGDAENAHVEINRETGEVKVKAKKLVVENVENIATEISLENAKLRSKRAKLGDELEIEINAETFKRNAIQNAKQIVIQKVREHEKLNIYNKFKMLEDCLVKALVKKTDEMGNLYVEISGIESIIPARNLNPNDSFVQGDIVSVYIGSVEEGTKFTKVDFSRNSEKFLEKLFEREVPEIASGEIEIKGIAREAGSRSKVALYSADETLDVKGACMGNNKMRLEAILSELQGEKIDLIEWDSDTRNYVSSALAPATVFSSEVVQEGDDIIARICVDNAQLSLAIGKKGQNSRLASKLCKVKIDIKGLSQEEQDEMLNEN